MKYSPTRLALLVAFCVGAAALGAERGPKPAYRSFCYDDWLCEFMVNPSPLEPKHLDMLVDEAAGGGADVLVMNPVGMTASHPSKVWQTMWKAYAAGNRQSAFGSIPQAEVPDHEAMLKELTRFAKLKIDYLAYTFASCRRRGIAAGASIRMNDVHGLGWGRNYLVSDFWLENQHLGFRSFFNYAHPQVREYFVKLIGEMIEDYDIDVLDLDFWRNPYCFPEDGKVDEHCDTMTAFVREVRGRIQKSKKKIVLLVKIPSSVVVARRQGLDVGRWAREGLIDGVILGGYLHAAWSASAWLPARSVSTDDPATGARRGESLLPPKHRRWRQEWRLRGPFAAGIRDFGLPGRLGMMPISEGLLRAVWRASRHGKFGRAGTTTGSCYHKCSSWTVGRLPRDRRALPRGLSLSFSGNVAPPKKIVRGWSAPDQPSVAERRKRSILHALSAVTPNRWRCQCPGSLLWSDSGSCSEPSAAELTAPPSMTSFTRWGSA